MEWLFPRSMNVCIRLVRISRPLPDPADDSFSKYNNGSPGISINRESLLCKGKRQYLLTCKVSRYCLLPLHGRVHLAPDDEEDTALLFIKWQSSQRVIVYRRSPWSPGHCLSVWHGSNHVIHILSCLDKLLSLIHYLIQLTLSLSRPGTHPTNNLKIKLILTFNYFHQKSYDIS